MNTNYFTEMQKHPFAIACYDGNSEFELLEALSDRRADPSDCQTWNITPSEWRESIKLALGAKIQDHINKGH